MIPSTSIVIDTETLCRKPSAVVFEVGMVAFHRADFTIIDRLSFPVELFHQIVAGRTIDPETVAFHRRNGTLPQTTGGHDALATTYLIREFVKKHKPRKVWIQGTCFDRPIIEDYVDAMGQPLPWHFGDSKDARTLWDTAFPNEKHAPRPHRALADAEATLHDIARCLIKLNAVESA